MVIVHVFPDFLIAGLSHLCQYFFTFKLLSTETDDAIYYLLKYIFFHFLETNVSNEI